MKIPYILIPGDGEVMLESIANEWLLLYAKIFGRVHKRPP